MLNKTHFICNMPDLRQSGTERQRERQDRFDEKCHRSPIYYNFNQDIDTSFNEVCFEH